MRNKEKVLLVNGSQFGYSAGHYHYCLHLKSDFDIRFICYDRGLKKIELEGVRVTYVDFGGGKLKRILAFLRAAIAESRAMKPDVLFVVYFNLAFLLPLFCRYKTSVLDIRTGSLLENNLQRIISNFMVRVQSYFFNKRVILSESLKTRLRIRNKNTLVLPLGSEVYYQGQHTYDHLHLLYLGVFDGRNITDTLFGLAMYLKKHPERKSSTTYTIIGFGAQEEERKLLAAMKELELEEVVKFKGRKNYTELHAYFERANTGVSYVPITDYYNLQPPTKTFEYILSGLFTIATSTFENKRLIGDKNGLLCEDNAASFAECLEKCYERRLSLNSAEIRETLSDYEWSKLVRRELLPFLQNG